LAKSPIDLQIYFQGPSLLFDHCAECQSCCHVDAGYGSLEITLTQTEAAVHQQLCIEDKCTHLGAQGCQLGDDKPLSCKLYPLSFDHEAKKYYFDAACPLLPEYKRQLKNPDSDAAQHMKKMDHLLMQLMDTDTDFLKRNREIDLDFFELMPLATPTYLKNKS
jgi:Fe-S-cluster containining protein